MTTLGPLDSPVREAWVALHGYGQLSPTFARYLTPLDDGQRLIVVPEGLSRFYLKDGDKVGASWMTREDRERDITDYVGYLDAVLDWLGDRPAATAPRTVLGFSQGSATAWRWAVMGRTAPARLVIWGGEVPHDLDLDLAAQRLRAATVTLVTGTEDPYCPPHRLAHYQQQLREAGIANDAVTFEGGHQLNQVTLRAVAAEPAQPVD